MSRSIVAILGCALAASVSAQNLTKAEEGRAALGACYGTCLRDGLQAGKNMVLERADRLFELLVKNPSDVILLSPELLESGLQYEQRAFCTVFAGTYNYLDECQAGCVDIEMAYGVNTSSARNKFHAAKRSVRGDLQSAGFWDDTGNRPLSGDALTTACDTFWESEAASSLNLPPRPLAR